MSYLLYFQKILFLLRSIRVVPGMYQDLFTADNTTDAKQTPGHWLQGCVTPTPALALTPACKLWHNGPF